MPIKGNRGGERWTQGQIIALNLLIAHSDVKRPDRG